MSCVIWQLKVCLLLYWPELIYYSATKVFLTAIRSISEIRNLSISSELFSILMRCTYNAKNCNLDLSVKWFKLNIELAQKCSNEMK